MPSPSPDSSPRLSLVLSLLSQAHLTDPNQESTTYHSTLSSYVDRLSQDAAQGPSEALVIAANAQHVRRWEKPRNEYPMGLAGYKMWRTNLNKFHSQIARELMVQAGYSETSDAELFKRVDELLLKQTMARPPLKYPLKDPEMHLFEDAICLTFLSTQFVQFSDQIDDTTKMMGIVAKTWAKMSTLGRGIAAEELVGTLPDELKVVVQKALKDAE
ncbi:BQ2448_5982 [Microbotryum intermedium]|uniref:BQ2448_5982 protein n=1 Tax=Microbotryum intermedium TaxID=269621 RepID=A0A238F8D7_9BASI|nr:BQ2448_5982 [Microbotryum intermedium]